MNNTFGLRRAAGRLIEKLLHKQLVQRIITNQFHRLYYFDRDRTWKNTYWFGHQLLKCPFDLWTYQEMLFELKPDVVIECGTCYGGSALFFAHLFDLIGNGRVITIDIDDKEARPQHERIEYLIGSSTSAKTVAKLAELIGGDERVMVILDSDHSMQHVLAELRIYGKLVSVESYIVVEDSNINGHPVRSSFGHGPMEAINAYLNETDQFVVDSRREKFYLSFNPRGYLKRKR